MGRVLNRSAEDVIAMAGKMKQMKQEDYTKLLMTTIQQSVPVEEKSEDDWSQAEQKAFETALQKYPKGTDERLAWKLEMGILKLRTLILQALGFVRY